MKLIVEWARRLFSTDCVAKVRLNIGCEAAVAEICEDIESFYLVVGSEADPVRAVFMERALVGVNPRRRWLATDDLDILDAVLQRVDERVGRIYPLLPGHELDDFDPDCLFELIDETMPKGDACTNEQEATEASTIPAYVTVSGKIPLKVPTKFMWLSIGIIVATAVSKGLDLLGKALYGS